MKLKGVGDAHGKHLGYRFYCPGCECSHWFRDDTPRWQFDGNMDSPNVKPSLLTTGGEDPNYRCHLFITNGQIQYLNDCSHSLAGQTIDLPNLHDEEGESS